MADSSGGPGNWPVAMNTENHMKRLCSALSPTRKLCVGFSPTDLRPYLGYTRHHSLGIHLMSDESAQSRTMPYDFNPFILHPEKRQ